MLRQRTGLNRKEFCKLVHIPYRTITEWELGNRHAPEYVLFLLEYYLSREGKDDAVKGEVDCLYRHSLVKAALPVLVVLYH